MGALDPADRLDGLDPVAAGLLLAGGDREGEAVHEDVLRGDAVVVAQVGDQAVGDAQLPVRGARLALLVDGQGDDRRPVLLDQRDDLGEARARSVAVLVVHRVDDRPAAEHLQAGLEDRRLGGVQHDRQRGGGGQPAGELAHVTGAVTAHVVHAQVEQVRPVADLGAGDLDARLPVLGQHGLAEGLGPVGVGPLPDGQVRGVLAEGHGLVQRGGGSLGDVFAGADLTPAHPLHHRAQVLRRRPAAATDQGQAVVTGEVVVGRGQLGRGQRVVRAVGREHRQPRIGHRRHGHLRVAREMAQVLAHLGRARRTVQADHVDAQRLEGGEGRADLGAEEHRAGRLDRDLGDQGHPAPRCGHRAAGSDEGRLGLQEVLGGLDQHRVDPALEEPCDLLLRRRHEGPRTVRGPGSAASCPVRPTRAPIGGGPGSSTRRPPHGRSGRRPMPALGSARGCRTPPGWPGWPRRCSSRRSRHRHRSTRRARRRRCRGGSRSGSRCSPRSPGSRPARGPGPGASCPSRRRRRSRARSGQSGRRSWP